jgi:hypothetical protein
VHRNTTVRKRGNERVKEKEESPETARGNRKHHSQEKRKLESERERGIPRNSQR